MLGPTHAFYREFFVMGRKTILTVASIIAENWDPMFRVRHLQLLVIKILKMVINLLVIYFSLLLTQRVSPYTESSLRRLEMFSHWICLLFSLYTYSYQTEMSEAIALQTILFPIAISQSFLLAFILEYIRRKNMKLYLGGDSFLKR